MPILARIAFDMGFKEKYQGRHKLNLSDLKTTLIDRQA